MASDREVMKIKVTPCKIPIAVSLEIGGNKRRHWIRVKGNDLLYGSVELPDGSTWKINQELFDGVELDLNKEYEIIMETEKVN